MTNGNRYIGRDVFEQSVALPHGSVLGSTSLALPQDLSYPTDSWHAQAEGLIGSNKKQ